MNDFEWSWTILNDLEWSWMILNDLEWSWMILNDLEWSWMIFRCQDVVCKLIDFSREPIIFPYFTMLWNILSLISQCFAIVPISVTRWCCECHSSISYHQVVLSAVWGDNYQFISLLPYTCNSRDSYGAKKQEFIVKSFLNELLLFT